MTAIMHYYLCIGVALVNLLRSLGVSISGGLFILSRSGRSGRAVCLFFVFRLNVLSGKWIFSGVKILVLTIGENLGY